MIVLPKASEEEPMMPPPGASVAAWRLAYAKLGWHTFLVHGIQADGHCTCGKRDCKAPGKHPVFPGKDRGATDDPVRISREGMKHPGANIGLHLGLSRLVCIDVDPRNGGNETLDRLEKQHGRLDAGIVAETGGGGRHYLFAASGEDTPLPNKGRLGSGIDVLHGTSYPVIAPSTHASGNAYRWAKGLDPWEGGWLLSPLPTWTVEHATRRRENVSDVTSDEDDWMADIPAGRPFEWTEENTARLRTALACVPAEARDMWLKMGAALHQASDGGPEGKELWDEWSEGSSSFDGHSEKYDQSVQGSTWEGFEAERPGGVTVASIFYEAKQHGWADPAKCQEPDTLGDISNGRLFAARCRDQFLYVRAGKRWLRWDGLRWAACDSGQHTQAAKALADTLVRSAAEAFTENPDDANKRRYTLALNIHRSMPRIYAMLDAASTDAGMSIPSPSELDRDPYLLGVKNGVLDLRTGKLLGAEPGQRISKQAGAAYDPRAECPRWEAFLFQVLGNKDVVAFIQRLVGYTLTGLVDEEVLVFMFGTGANGKSVFANVLMALLGDYAVTVGTELLARNKSEGETARYKAKLQGARLALANEVGQADTWDDQRVKEVTSREHIPARLLYGEAFQFMPTHALWIRGNHMPTILDASEGMWRRLIMIPFAKQFAPDQRISDLDRKLFEGEGSGILAWAVRGCLEWQQGGLRAPVSISSATQQYRSESDVLEQWLSEHCVEQKDGRMGVGEAYEGWRSFCQNIGITPGAQPTFTRRMKGRGIKYRKSNGKALFEGILTRVRDDADDL